MYIGGTHAQAHTHQNIFVLLCVVFVSVLVSHRLSRLVLISCRLCVASRVVLNDLKDSAFHFFKISNPKSTTTATTILLQ